MDDIIIRNISYHNIITAINDSKQKINEEIHDYEQSLVYPDDIYEGIHTFLKNEDFNYNISECWTKYRIDPYILFLYYHDKNYRKIIYDNEYDIRDINEYYKKLRGTYIIFTSELKDDKYYDDLTPINAEEFMKLFFNIVYNNLFLGSNISSVKNEIRLWFSFLNLYLRNIPVNNSNYIWDAIFNEYKNVFYDTIQFHVQLHFQPVITTRELFLKIAIENLYNILCKKNMIYNIRNTTRLVENYVLDSTNEDYFTTDGPHFILEYIDTLNEFGLDYYSRMVINSYNLIKLKSQIDIYMNHLKYHHLHPEHFPNYNEKWFPPTYNINTENSDLSEKFIKKCGMRNMYKIYGFLKTMIPKYRLRKYLKWMNSKNRVISEIKSLPSGYIHFSFRGGDDYILAHNRFNII
jgi:hypothetical protein